MIKRIVLLGAFALATGAMVRLMTAPAPAVALPGTDLLAAQTALLPAPTPNGEVRPGWRLLWSRAAPDLVSASLAPDGSSVAWVDNHGSVRRMSGSEGRTLWRTESLKGVNRVLALPERNGAAGGVLIYARMNPASPLVGLLDPAMGTNRRASFPVEGAVWSAAVAPGGDHAVVGTGHSLLYVLPLPAAIPATVTGATTTAAPPKIPSPLPIKVRVQGIPEVVTVASGEPVALAGTWQDAGVGAWGLDGMARWRHHEPQADRTYEVHLSADGAVAVAVSSRGPKEEGARLHVWNAHTGQLLWSQDLEASGARALVSADGRFIAVSYLRDVDSDGALNPSSERRLVLFDREGHRAFPEKGGLFFAPELVALSADGQRLTVRDSSGYLWTLDGRGHILSRVRLALDPKTGAPPKIDETIPSADGRFLLLRRGDGVITLFKATAL